MAKSRLELIIDATDNASGVFGKIGAAAKTGLAVGVGAAVAGVGALAVALGDSVREAMAAEEITAQLNSVLKSTGGVSGMTADSINAIAQGLSEVTRFEDDAIVSGQSLLLTFTNIGKDVFPTATETMLNMSQALGQDLKTSATQLGKALNDPIQGVSALSRVGIQFTDAQKEMIGSLVESGDIMGAQKIILKELETQFGGSARAAGQTMAGQMDILKNSFGNIKEEVGGALLPVLTQFVSTAGPGLIAFAQDAAQWIITALIPALTEIGTWLGTNLPPVIAAISTAWQTVLLPALVAVGTFIGTNIIPVLQQVGVWLGTNLPPVIAALSTAWQTVLWPAIQVVWDILANKLIPLIRAFVGVEIAALKLALTALAGLWQKVLKPAFDAMWKFLSENLGPVFNTIATVLNTVLGPAFTSLKNNVLDPVTKAFGNIGAAIDGVIGWLDNLKNKLPTIKLPDWLTPGSPTPLETGLWGIRDALQAVGRLDLPGFGASMLAPAYAGAGRGGGTISNQITVNVHGGGDPYTTGQVTEAAVRRALVQVLERDL